MLVTRLLPLVLAGAMVAPAAAQTLDMSALRDIDEIDIVGSDGSKIGEIEDVLIDQSGQPVAVTVDFQDGFLDLGDDDVILTMDQLTFENGSFATSLTEQEIEGLPRRND